MEQISRCSVISKHLAIKMQQKNQQPKPQIWIRNYKHQEQEVEFFCTRPIVPCVNFTVKETDVKSCEVWCTIHVYFTRYIDYVKICWISPSFQRTRTVSTGNSNGLLFAKMLICQYIREIMRFSLLRKFIIRKGRKRKLITYAAWSYNSTY